MSEADWMYHARVLEDRLEHLRSKLKQLGESASYKLQLAADKVAELEAENRCLREEIQALRNRRTTARLTTAKTKIS